MISSIQHFIKKETYEIEKHMREFVKATVDIDTYSKELHDKSLKLVRSILVEPLELMDQTIRNSAKRQEAYGVE